jgi:hypothetical protein
VTGPVTVSVPLDLVSEFTDAPVPAGTYTFTVQARNVAGTSNPSLPVTLTFSGPCESPPQTPTNFVAHKAGGFVHLFWDPPAGGPSPAGYTLNVNGSFVGVLPVSGTTFSAVASPGRYDVSVSSTNPCGTSGLTAVQTIVVR